MNKGEIRVRTENNYRNVFRKGYFQNKSTLS